ncbi:MAG: tetratricopeptide repeat protein [Planctomycetota bacterium]|jgi:tetratricopeptide (TPR) repeat protein
MQESGASWSRARAKRWFATVTAGVALIAVTHGASALAQPEATDSQAPGERVLPLQEALAGVSASLASLGGPQATYAVRPCSRASLLDGYIAHMIGAHLESAGIAVQPFDGCLTNADLPPPDDLPKPLLQELRIAGIDVFVSTATSTKNGQRYLLTASYEASTGQQRAATRTPCHLTKEMEELLTRERVSMKPNNRRWLELFEEMFPAFGERSAPDRLLDLAEATYFFEAGLWTKAGPRFLDVAAWSPDRQFMRGVFALQLAGEWETAQESVHEMLENHHPDSGPLYALQSWLRVRQGELQDALPLLEQARLSDLGREGLYRYARALIALERENDEVARRELISAAELLPDRLFAQRQLARFHWNRGELDSAIACYRRAIEASEPTADTWRELAGALEAAGDVDGAIEALRQAFQMRSGNLVTTQHLASLLKRQGQHSQALEVLRRAADAHPRSAALLVAYGDSAAEMWHIKTAESAFEKSTTAAGEFPYGKVRLADVLTLQRRYRDARNLLTDLLAVRPDYQPARIQLARMLAELGHVDEAVASLREVATSPEFQHDTRMALVEILLAADRAEEAVECAQLAAVSQPNAETYAALSEALVAAGDMAKADTAAATAVESDGLSAPAHLAVARVLQAKGELTKAAAETQQALELNPYSIEALELAGELCQEVGNFRKCADFWRQALALNPWHAQLHLRLSRMLGPKLGDWAAYKEHSAMYAELEEARTEAGR